MEWNISIGGTQYRVDPKGLDISIPMQFDGPQPNTYGVPPASSVPFEGEGFIGDTRRGGSCNFETVTLNPHCNGTHTECVGHIALDRIRITEVLQPGLIPATLISVNPQPISQSAEHFPSDLNDSLEVIDRNALEMAEMPRNNFSQALIFRSLPNDPSKKNRDYMKTPPSFFSVEAIRWMNEVGVDHLITDLPSLDPLFDLGRMSGHREFWGVPPGKYEERKTGYSDKTITEMVYIPDEIPDGACFLNLEIAPFASDAAPSRPVIYQILD